MWHRPLASHLVPRGQHPQQRTWPRAEEASRCGFNPLHSKSRPPSTYLSLSSLGCTVTQRMLCCFQNYAVHSGWSEVRRPRPTAGGSASGRRGCKQQQQQHHHHHHQQQQQPQRQRQRQPPPPPQQQQQQHQQQQQTKKNKTKKKKKRRKIRRKRKNTKHLFVSCFASGTKA